MGAGVRADGGGGFLTRREHTHNIHFSTGPINTRKRTAEAHTPDKKRIMVRGKIWGSRRR